MFGNAHSSAHCREVDPVSESSLRTVLKRYKHTLCKLASDRCLEEISFIHFCLDLFWSGRQARYKMEGGKKARNIHIFFRWRLKKKRLILATVMPFSALKYFILREWDAFWFNKIIVALETKLNYYSQGVRGKAYDFLLKEEGKYLAVFFNWIKKKIVIVLFFTVAPLMTVMGGVQAFSDCTAVFPPALTLTWALTRSIFPTSLWSFATKPKQDWA